MYRSENRSQLNLDEFILPFGGELDIKNRWIHLAGVMPWEFIESIYEAKFKNDSKEGRPPISARIAFGAIYIKEQENLTDEGTVMYIAENPYMQFFLGLKGFENEKLFDPSMMVYFRKRFDNEDINAINEELYKRSHKDSDSGEQPPSPPQGDGQGKNSGKVILDATCAPSDIRYPTDASLLNESREWLESIIDALWRYGDKQGHKTSCSRLKARREFLAIQKQRKPRKKNMRRFIARQLEFICGNLAMIDSLLKQSGEGKLSSLQEERLVSIRTLYRQQYEMYESNSHSCKDRIVSLRQPYIRPIVRGKAGCAAEFGQKITVSVVNGYTFIEKQSWDNFSEGCTLQESAEQYKNRFGCYPEAILADSAYRTEANSTFCKKNGIRLSGPRKGRKSEAYKENERLQASKDGKERNIVESRFGISKRRYGLDLIMSYLQGTAETEAALQILAMNVALVLRAIFHLLSNIGIKWHLFINSDVFCCRIETHFVFTYE
jgi:hypothetical protein